MKTRREHIIDVMLFIALFYAGAVGLMLIGQRSLIYFPDKNRPDPALFKSLSMETADVTTEDSLILQGWFKAPAGKKSVILYFHGNAGNIGSRIFKIEPLINAGYGVLLAEYRGYGGNPGKPSERGFYTDTHAYLKWLVERGYRPEGIVLYGESIGSGPAVELASKTPGFEASILETPFTSLPDVGKLTYPYFPVRLLMADRFDNIGKIREIHCPVLILHGTADDIVPYTQGLDLFGAANQPKKMESFAMGGHENLYSLGAGDRVLTFLEELEKAP